MLPRDWFSVGTRLIGVYTFVRASAYFAAFLLNFLFATSDSQATMHTEQGNAFMGVFHLALAAILVFGAEPITRIVFKEPEPGPRSDEPEGIDSE